MPQCQFLFSAVFVFEKSYTGNILGIGQNKAKVPIYLTRRQSAKGETEQSQEAATPGGGVGHPPGRSTPWCGPLGRPPTSPFCL
jgi:hypothetical protein